jgi:hypothetical protein
MQIRRAQPSESIALKDWIAANHYLQSCPPGFVQMLEFIEGKERIGGMLIGRPAAKTYDPNHILQVHRVWFIDETERCAESKALGLMRKHIRVWLPQIRLLLSYSDPSAGHVGTIYKADGWAFLGLTDEAWGYGWESRKGRRDQKVSRKMRWVRTP